MNIDECATAGIGGKKMNEKEKKKREKERKKGREREKDEGVYGHRCGRSRAATAAI